MGVLLKNKLTVLLLLCLILSGTLTAGLVKAGRESTQKTLQSSLLNKKYVDSVSQILISMPANDSGIGEQIVLSRTERHTGNRWLVSLPGGNGSILTDSGKVGQLLGLLSATESFTVTSETYKDWNSLGVTEEKGVTVIVRGTDSDGNELEFSRLCFGLVSAAGTHIAVRNDRKQTVYHVKDVYSSFFTSDGQFWCKKELFPELNEFLPDAVAEIRIQQDGYTRVLYPGEEKFDGAASVFKSITGGLFVFTGYLDGSEQPVIELTVTAGIGGKSGGSNNLVWKVSLLKTEEGLYIAQCQSPWDIKYVTVSNWTAQRLFI